MYLKHIPTACVGVLIFLTACAGDEPAPVMVLETTPPVASWPVVDKDFSFMWSKEGGYAPSTGENMSFEYSDKVTEFYHNGMSADTLYIKYTQARQPEEGGELWLHGSSVIDFAGEVDSIINYVSTFHFETASLLPLSALRLEASVNRGSYKTMPAFVVESTEGGYRYSAPIWLSNVTLRFSVAEEVGDEFALTRLQLFSEGLPAGSELLMEETFQNYGSIEGFPALYTFDGNVVYNPKGNNHHEDNSLVWGLTQGFVGLYPENGEGSITFGPFEAVQLAELWFSSNGLQGNHQIWYKQGGGDYRLAAQIVMNQFAGIGKYLRIRFPEIPKQVTFQIRAGHETAHTKLHGFRIWK